MYPALHDLAGKGSTEGVSTLLEGKADVNVVNARGETVLFGLVLNIQAEIPTTRVMQVLFEHNVDVDVKDKYGTTVIQAMQRPVNTIPRWLKEIEVWKLVLSA
jgi:hypothetical protein